MLKGRSAASPPNPNLVPSGKVPPPVPPRGTGASRTGRSSEDHRAAGTASTTSSATSSRGDEAAIITRYRLHDSSCDLHHPFLPDHSSTSTSITAKTVASTITAATSTKATSAISNALHVRTSVSNTYRVTDHFDRKAGRIRPMDLIQGWHVQELDEEEEFISVEKVEDAYFIKTSLRPLRPDRGIRRSDRSKDSSGTMETDNRKVSKKDKERRGDTKTDHLAKFTYFLNPASRADQMNYKMSRKDKKHSETYYEKIKRKQKNLEASVTTITTMSHRHKSVADARMHHTDASHAKDKPTEEWTKQKILKFASTKKDSILLQKIREKSRRKKRLAPKPSPKKGISVRGTFNGNLAENERTSIKKESEKLSLRMRSLENKSDNYEIQEELCFNKNKTEFTSERKQSVIGCNETKQSCSFGRDYNYLDKKNISKNINDERNNRCGFREIFPNSYRLETENTKNKIVCERVSKFDQQINERLKRYKNEGSKSDCKSCDGKEGSVFDDIRKNNMKDANQDKFVPSTSKREEFVFFSFNDRNSDVVKSSVSEKVKTFEKIKTDVRDETKDVRREDVHLNNLDHENEDSVIKQKLALPVNKIRLNQKEKKIVLKAGLLNTGAKRERQTFKSLSSDHCNDLSFNPKFGMPNVSFLHTYRKTRSFT